MSTLQLKLNEILAKRAERGLAVDGALAKWRAYQADVDKALLAVAAAERVNPDLNGSESRLNSVAGRIRRVLLDYEAAKNRFARNTLCIGIGGAARMGKSTFLQAATGLGDVQIPTSDKYFTTAIPSKIENCPNETEGIAVAEFHSKASFLRDVIEPMCRTMRIPAPLSFDDFRTCEFSLPEGADQTLRAVLKRLKDAQCELGTYEELLTGECGKRIPLDKLRPYVAYPQDGLTKAGPFLAIKDLVIRSRFPSTDVALLKFIDLPGLGESGRDLAEVQTGGMRDVCDITLLMKRPGDKNIAWTGDDANALDAMKHAVPLLDDQTKYTLILANVVGETPDRAEGCIKSIKAELAPRLFEITECDARDRVLVTERTMPQVLDFLARNLPLIDGAIVTRLTNDATQTLNSIRQDVFDVLTAIRKVAPAGTGEIDFANRLFDSVVGVLTEQERLAGDKASGNDREWDEEVGRTHDAVVQWVNAGCGYGSREAMLEAITSEIKRDRAQPAHVINQCRVKFRAEWEAMDLHLTSRIGRLLSGAMDALLGVMHSFVPVRDLNLPEIDAVRAQICEFADRIDSRHTDLGDDVALAELSRPLRRIAEFDLQFRFHLEPMLHAMTHLLVANELPLVKDYNDAENFMNALLQKLTEAADAYAAGMRKSGTGNNAAFERKKKLIEGAIPNASVRADVIRLLEQAMGSAQSFCPNRIFAAVMETFADAFIRSKDSEKAFQILAREWKSELMPAPDEKTRLTNAAAGAMADLVKKI